MATLRPARRALPTRPPPPIWRWLLPLLLALLALGGGWWALSRPRNPAVSAAALNRTLGQDWQALRAYGPRPVGTPAHDQALTWLEGQLTSLGYRVTRQPVELERPFDLGGTLQGEGRSFPVKAMYGALGGEQQGRLVYVSPETDDQALQRLGLTGQIALSTCPAGRLSALVERLLTAGALGVVVFDDCPNHALQRVLPTALPLVTVAAAQRAAVLALSGQMVTLKSRVELREVTGHNLVAARVNAAPEVLLGAHVDTVNGTLGANDNSSGVLAVAQAARQATRTTLADRAWFVLFDAEEDGLFGSRAFVHEYRYPLRRTRAMLNFDMVGVGVQPLGVAAPPDLLVLSRQVRPGIRSFEDEPLDARRTFGRVPRITGRSDHGPFKTLGVRTVFLHRGIDPHYHAPGDQTVNLALVQDAADFALKLSQAALQAPWQERPSCGITNRECMGGASTKPQTTR